MNARCGTASERDNWWSRDAVAEMAVLGNRRNRHGCVLALQLLKPFDRFLAEEGRLTGDRRLSCAFHPRDTPIQRGDQLVELTNELATAYRHGRAVFRVASRRDTFQISPQLPHRQ